MASRILLVARQVAKGLTVLGFALAVCTQSLAQTIEFQANTTIDSTLTPNHQTDSIIASYRAQIDSLLSTPIGESTDNMVTRRPESALTRLLSDVLMDAARDYCTAKGLPEPDIALLNIGGIRKDLPRGTVHLRDIYEITPFDNTLVIVEVSGDTLRSVLDHVAQRGGEALSGVEMSIRNRTLVSAKVGGEDIDSNRTYRIATADYLADGGDNFYALMGQPRIDTGLLLRDQIAEQFEKRSAKGLKLEPPTNVRVEKLQ